MTNQHHKLPSVIGHFYSFLLVLSFFHKNTIHSFQFLPVSTRSVVLPLKHPHQRRPLTSLHQSSSNTTPQSISPTESLTTYTPYFSFSLDPWQITSGQSILSHHNLIVTAPTGSGKTVIAEMALHTSFASSTPSSSSKCVGIYTTPLKALSNQKFIDLRTIFGTPNVGLLTGDVSINRNAPILVMTTEVYRNLCWKRDVLPDDFLSHVDSVILDEFHYMGDKGRGGVWEECVITSPAHIRIIALSATLSNAEDLCRWMEDVTSKKTDLVEAGLDMARPVPLRYWYASSYGMGPLFREEEAGPGARLGLLGLRGDGVKEIKKKKKKWTRGRKSGGFGKEEEEQKGGSSMPKGLQIHPGILQAEEKRQRKVDRAVKRSMQRDLNDIFDDEYDEYRIVRRNRKREAREEAKRKEQISRREMRREVPSLSLLIERLRRKNLLPAIFFLFSRAGCDEAAMAAQKVLLSSELIGDEEEGGRKGRRRVTSTAESGRKGYGSGGEQQDQSRKRKGRGRGRKHEAREGMDAPLTTDDRGRSFRINNDRILSDQTLEAILNLDTEYSNNSPSYHNDDDNSNFLSSIQPHSLLTPSQIHQSHQILSNFNTQNPEISLPPPILQQYLLGVASHHAGLLPAHKSLIERLFQTQLLKVIFATETLAAGMNMPARTTVICSLAKRGDTGHELLKTSNLLQMAGRAGRRGMDEAGTVVILPTPFEGAREAVQILTKEVEPIESQFRPGYSLVVNLIRRGRGRLDLARELVGKSFAVWETRKIGDGIQKQIKMEGDDDDDEFEMASTHLQILSILKDIFQKQHDQINNDPQTSSQLQTMIQVLSDRNLLKNVSKSFEGTSRLLRIERETLSHLRREMEQDDTTIIDEESFILVQQQETISQYERKLRRHVFADMAATANEILRNANDNDDDTEVNLLRLSLSKVRNTQPNDDIIIAPNDIAQYVKSIYVPPSKSHKNAWKRLSKSLEEQTDNDKTTQSPDDAYNDLTSITQILQAYGCIIPQHRNENKEEHNYAISPAGQHVSQVSFGNSLWIITAMGGAYDIHHASSDVDYFFFDNNDDEQPPTTPQREADTLSDILSTFTPAEMAGYVSALLSDNSSFSRQQQPPSFLTLESFTTERQQHAFELTLVSQERLRYVQTQNGYAKGDFGILDFNSVKLVTSWAEGASWNELLESCQDAMAAGDLVRILSRVLDGLRQIGGLTYYPVKRDDGSLVLGVRSDICRLCKEAMSLMDRYPVKDMLPFESEEEEEEEVEEGIDWAEDVEEDKEDGERG